MKKLKYRYHRLDKKDIEYPVFTQPSMAFTPRQILEQFASGEVIAQENSPSDEYYDDKYTEDQLMNLHFIDDDFQARQAVLDYNENEQDEVKTRTNVPSGSEGTPKNDESSGKSTESGEQTQTQTPA